MDRLTLRLTKDREEIGRVDAPAARDHAQRLLPSIYQLLACHALRMHDLDAVKVYPGPGSFTGIRVGMSVGQALAYALQIPVNGKKMPMEPVEVKYE